MASRVPAVAAVLVLAAAPAFAQDCYEPNPSLAQLTADDAYVRESAKSLKTAQIGPALVIRLDEQGRVIVAGWRTVARLDTAGRLDPTFGSAGIAAIPVWGDPSGLEIDAAGRILVTGCFYDGNTYPPDSGNYTGQRYGAARFLADGSLDLSFSGGGVLVLDKASGLQGLGEVRASGIDGAMLAVAEKPDPTAQWGWPPPRTGLVRMTADGTLDATYGGGFAQLAETSPLVSFAPISFDVQVPDFAVDPAGRAVVSVWGRDGNSFAVQRLDAAGAMDLSFAGFQSWGWAASHLALDGAQRIVSLDGGLSRSLPDGTPDTTFSGNGSARLEGIFIDGLTLAQRAQICAAESSDPSFDAADDPLCGGGQLLAVATKADRWALAKVVVLRDAKYRAAGHAIEVRSVDPADPGAIVTTTYRFLDQHFSALNGLAITPDGTTAYALGATFVLRVDLASPKPLPLPDLRAKWLGWPHAVDLGGGRYRVSARVRIRNVSRHDAESVVGYVGFGDGTFGVPLAPRNGSTNSIPFRVRARSSVVKRFTWEGGDSSTNLSSARLAVQVSCELPDANFADNTATSLPMTPVYVPR